MVQLLASQRGFSVWGNSGLIVNHVPLAVPSRVNRWDCPLQPPGGGPHCGKSNIRSNLTPKMAFAITVIMPPLRSLNVSQRGQPSDLSLMIDARQGQSVHLASLCDASPNVPRLNPRCSWTQRKKCLGPGGSDHRKKSLPSQITRHERPTVLGQKDLLAPSPCCALLGVVEG
ncbi:MAG: hypothetical protein CM15mP39_08950 [Synechococcus sp.]|nr:MAG: hypothetical protein CM15mP39_08950 [Synechococcus sp.]